MRPDLFPLFIWERLTWWSQWLTDPKHTGRADVIGAGTTALIVGASVIAYVQRDRLQPVVQWIKARPIITTALVTPVAALALICLSKFATFIGSTLTVVGLLIALDNNRRGHDRETRKFTRQEMAARTAFTHELSAICEYAEGLIDAYVTIHDLTPDQRNRLGNSAPPFPPFPATATATIKDMINSTDNAAVAHRCAQLQRYLQIIRTNLRLKTKISDFSEPGDNTQMMRALVLYALATSLIGFAREQDPEPANLDWDTIDTHAIFLGLGTNTDFQAYLTRAQQREADPIYFNDRRLRKAEQG